MPRPGQSEDVREVFSPLSSGGGTLIRVSAIFLFILASSAPAKAQADIVFAFANQAGTHLLTVPMEEGGSASAGASHLNKALCGGNRLLEVAFEQHQTRGPKDTGRQISHNFEQSEGDRYRIANGKVQDDEVCLLVDEGFFVNQQLLHLARQPGDCSDNASDLLSATVKRTVTRCAVLGGSRRNAICGS